MTISLSVTPGAPPLSDSISIPIVLLAQNGSSTHPSGVYVLIVSLALGVIVLIALAYSARRKPTVSLTADPSTVQRGQSVTLSWKSQYATQLDLQPGVGKVDAKGSTNVTPQDSTSYTITATGRRGKATTSTCQVTVTPAPQVGRLISLMPMQGKGPGQVHEIGLVERAVIGRGRECDLVLADDDQVSTRHCELALVEDRVVLKDLGSTNGTILNGVPVVGLQRLETDDLVRIGRTEFRITIGRP